MADRGSRCGASDLQFETRTSQFHSVAIYLLGGYPSGALLSFSSAFWCFADVDISYHQKSKKRRYLYHY